MFVSYQQYYKTITLNECALTIMAVHVYVFLKLKEKYFSSTVKTLVSN